MLKLDPRGVILFFFIFGANIIYYFIWLYLGNLSAVITVLLAMNLLGIFLYSRYLKSKSKEWHRELRPHSDSRISKSTKHSKTRRHAYRAHSSDKSDNSRIIQTALLIMGAFFLISGLVVFAFSQEVGFYILVIGTGLTIIDGIFAWVMFNYV